MTLLIGLAARNLTRNLMRTLITSAAVVFGVMMMISGWGMIDGLDENVIRAEEDALSGHVLLRPDAYPDDGLSLPLDVTLAPSAALQAKLADPRVTASTDRIWFTTRLIKGGDSVRAKGLGYNPQTDPVVFPRDLWKVEGAWPQGPDQLAVASGLARLLKLQVGDAVTLEARTRAGALNALQFTISGVVSTLNAGVDTLTVWLPMPTAEALVLPEGARTSVAVRLKGGRGDADAAKAWLSGDGWKARTATEAVTDILAINNIRRRALTLMVGILMAIAATGIANTVIMATYERVREIGTLRAMGMGPGAVQALFLMEGAAMGVSAGGLGAALGAALVYWYSVHGIDLSAAAAAQGAELSFSTMLYLHFSWSHIVISFLFGTAIAVLASIDPARHAATLNPADAVRAD